MRDALRHLDYEAQVQLLSPDGAREDPAHLRVAAARGTESGGGALPFASELQRSFGRHDLSGVQAHTGQPAQEAAEAMGAAAYAQGEHIAFGQASPTLYTVAHETAHVLQQRAGLSLPGGVGRSGDDHERHADAVAERVVRGECVEDMFDAEAGHGGTQSASNAKAPVQRQDLDPSEVTAKVGDVKPDDKLKLDLNCALDSDEQSCIALKELLDTIDHILKYAEKHVATADERSVDNLDGRAALSLDRSKTEEEARERSDDKKKQDDSETLKALLGLFGGFATVFAKIGKAVKAVSSIAETVNAAASLGQGVAGMSSLHRDTPAPQRRVPSSVNAELSTLSAFVKKNLTNAAVEADLSARERLDLLALELPKVARRLVNASDRVRTAEGMTTWFRSTESRVEAMYRTMLGARLRVQVAAETPDPTQLERREVNRHFLEVLVEEVQAHGNRHGLNLLRIATPAVRVDPRSGEEYLLPPRVTEMLGSSNARVLERIRVSATGPWGSEPVHLPGFGTAQPLTPEQLSILRTAAETEVVPVDRFERHDLLLVHGFGGVFEVPAGLWRDPAAKQAWLEQRHAATRTPRPGEPQNLRLPERHVPTMGSGSPANHRGPNRR